MLITLSVIWGWCPVPISQASAVTTGRLPKRAVAKREPYSYKQPIMSVSILGRWASSSDGWRNVRAINVAVVATAQKLVVIAWQMLKAHEPYRYAQPQSVEYKLEQLHVTATGRSGNAAMPRERHDH
jgi:hypothetical protein